MNINKLWTMGPPTGQTPKPTYNVDLSSLAEPNQRLYDKFPFFGIPDQHIKVINYSDPFGPTRSLPKVKKSSKRPIAGGLAALFAAGLLAGGIDGYNSLSNGEDNS